MNFENPQDAHRRWQQDPTPENLAIVVNALQPVINSEVQRIGGPTSLLRARAKILAANAARTWDPAGASRLQSWAVTQLQPLMRYKTELSGPAHVPEMVGRQAAELARLSREASDELGRDPTDDELSERIGMPVKRVQHLRAYSKASVTDSVAEESGNGGSALDINDGSLQAAASVVHASADPRDRFIMEHRTGMNGKPMLEAAEIARRLGVSPAFVSQRAAHLAGQVTETQPNV